MRPSEVLQRLVGDWDIQRTYDGANASFEGGRLHFEALPQPGHYRYFEEGKFAKPGNDGQAPRTFESNRTYYFTETDNGFGVFFDAAQTRLFHAVTLAPIGSMMHAAGSHKCLRDFYHTAYQFFGDGRFRIDHHVRGPRKDYAIHSVFTHR